jgi:hypothetical protein
MIWIADAHRGDGKRFVVRADEKLTAYLELESAIRACGESDSQETPSICQLVRSFTAASVAKLSQI